MKILLHVCCAPCSTSSVEKLQQLGYQPVLFFYNPNILPKKEYNKRLAEVRRFATLKKLSLIEGDYDPKDWIKAVKEQAFATEKSRARCRICYRYRLEQTANKTLELGLDAFTTTLSVSPHKDSKIIFAEGKAVADELGIKFLEIDFKKENGYQRSLELCKELNIYRQEYCGCIYSLLERRGNSPYN